MIKTILISLAIVVLCEYTHSQVTFEKSYGGSQREWGTHGLQTIDGGYVCVGITKSYGAGVEDVYFIKTDMYGDSLWTKTYGGTLSDVGQSVIQTYDGGFILCGYTKSFGAGDNDAYLIKTNFYGDTAWTRTFGGADSDIAYRIMQLADSSYLFTGSTKSIGAGDEDITLTKISKTGTFLWSKIYGGVSTDRGYRCLQTFDGGFIIAGMTYSYGAGDCDMYLVKTDINGDTLWTRTFGGSNTDLSFDIDQCADSGYIISGATTSFGSGNYDIYVIRTDANGDSIWTRVFGGTQNDFGGSVIITNDGGYAIIGQSEIPPFFVADVYLIKLDVNGATSWIRTYGGENKVDFGNDIKQTSDGGFFITATGTFLDFDVYLIKTDNFGNLTHINENIPNEGKVNIFPNPCFDHVVIESEVDVDKIEITDHTGRVVSKVLIGYGKDSMIVDLSDIAGGLYYIILSGNNSVHVGKLTKY